MKFVINEIRQQKLATLIALTIVGIFVQQYISTMITRMIPLIMESATKNVSLLRLISKIISFAIIDTILEILLSRKNLINQKLYTGMMEKLIDKILDIDLIAFDKYSIDKVQTMSSNISTISQTIKMGIQLTMAIATMVTVSYTIFMICREAILPVVIFIAVSICALKFIKEKSFQGFKRFVSLMQKRTIGIVYMKTIEIHIKCQNQQRDMICR